MVVGAAAHRRGGNFGKDFSSRTGPTQTNDMAKAIGAALVSRFLKSVGEPAGAQSVNRYMYLNRDQEWRGWTAGEHARGQCDVHPLKLEAPFPPRMPQEQAIDEVHPPVKAEPEARNRAWLGTMIKLTGCITRRTWNFAVAGLPVFAGLATGIIWNRRDVSMAPILFALFRIWGYLGGSQARALR